MSEYIMNKETGKIELHFDKAEYMSLSDEMKREIKGAFLFSRYSSAWVSRTKFPNLWRAEAVAKKLGLSNGGNVGERLTFEEQQERKAERAEARAERMEYRAEKAIDKMHELQKPITDMHGDIAFFTQPNINSSAGRAFTRKRERMWEKYEKGFEEFKKSEYYQSRAAAARNTASKPTSKSFCQRRIDEANKTIRDQKKNIDHYQEGIEKIENGTTMKRYNGEVITIDDYNDWIDKAEEIIENAIEKVIYYQSIMDDLGGIEFSKDNIKPGYIVRIEREPDAVKVISCGNKNITYQIISGGAKGFTLKESYAGIKEIVCSDVSDEIEHPFKVGESFTVEVWNGGGYIEKTYTITKVTNEKVTLKSGNDRAITRRPRRGIAHYDEWYLGITDGRNGTISRKGA